MLSVLWWVKGKPWLSKLKKSDLKQLSKIKCYMVLFISINWEYEVEPCKWNNRKWMQKQNSKYFAVSVFYTYGSWATRTAEWATDPGLRIHSLSQSSQIFRMVLKWKLKELNSGMAQVHPQNKYRSKLKIFMIWTLLISQNLPLASVSHQLITISPAEFHGINTSLLLLMGIPFPEIAHLPIPSIKYICISFEP